MISPIANYNQISYRGKDKLSSQSPGSQIDLKDQLFQASVQEINKKVTDNVPLANKITDTQTRTMTSLSILAAGALVAPITSVGLDRLSGANGVLVKASQFISNKTTGFDKWLNKVDIGRHTGKIIKAIKGKLFQQNNIQKFKEGFYSGGGLMSSAQAVQAEALKAGRLAQAAVAQRSIETLNQVKNLGVLGRTFGKIGIFFKKNTTGGLGIINGIFAAMTVNSVLNAKKGERKSTLMEEVLGTWVGSLGGFRLFENVLKGLEKFEVKTIVQKAGHSKEVTKIAGNGLIPNIARIVNRIPLKGFIFPMIGAMLISSAMQKLSHLLFGKPTKEEPKVIDSVDSLQLWLKHIGWSVEEVKALDKVVQQHAAANNMDEKELKQAVVNEVVTNGASANNIKEAVAEQVAVDKLNAATVN
ncbi:MAG: hypothetical protein AB1782_08895 [Cyanobacteriota bacterium]